MIKIRRQRNCTADGGADSDADVVVVAAREGGGQRARLRSWPQLPAYDADGATFFFFIPTTTRPTPTRPKHATPPTVAPMMRARLSSSSSSLGGSDGEGDVGLDGGGKVGGGGDSGGGEEGGAAMTMVGVLSTVMESAVEAAVAVLRLEESDDCTVAVVVVVGTLMVAVISTLAATTLTITADASTPASAANDACSAVVFW